MILTPTTSPSTFTRGPPELPYDHKKHVRTKQLLKIAIHDNLDIDKYCSNKKKTLTNKWQEKNSW